LATWYQLQLALPGLEAQYFKFQEEKAQMMRQIEEEGEKNEDSSLIIPDNKLVDMNGNAL
jgi:hypothetical protein